MSKIDLEVLYKQVNWNGDLPSLYDHNVYETGNIYIRIKNAFDVVFRGDMKMSRFSTSSFFML